MTGVILQGLLAYCLVMFGALCCVAGIGVFRSAWRMHGIERAGGFILGAATQGVAVALVLLAADQISGLL